MNKIYCGLVLGNSSTTFGVIELYPFFRVGDFVQYPIVSNYAFKIVRIVWAYSEKADVYLIVEPSPTGEQK